MRSCRTLISDFNRRLRSPSARGIVWAHYHSPHRVSGPLVSPAAPASALALALAFWRLAAGWAVMCSLEPALTLALALALALALTVVPRLQAPGASTPLTAFESWLQSANCDQSMTVPLP